MPERNGASAVGTGDPRPVLDMPERNGASAVGTEDPRPVLDMPERNGASAVGTEDPRPVLDMPERNGARASGVGVGPHANICWNRDEWDVSLSDGGVYRIFRDRDTDGWFIDGVFD
jgi:hypothetical protein